MTSLLEEIKSKDFNDKEKEIEMIMKKEQSINDYYDKLIEIDDEYHDTFMYYRQLMAKYRDLYNNLSIFNVFERKRMLDISITIQRLIIKTFMDYYNYFYYNKTIIFRRF